MTKTFFTGLFNRTTILLLCCAALLAMQVSAQSTTGSISGVVKDVNGAAVPAAAVSIANPATGIQLSAESNESGEFTVPQLPPGTYTVTIEKPGFKRFEKTGVVLSASDRLNAGEFALEVGGAAETVTVTADSAELQLKTESGERSDLIEGRQIRDLALNGRNLFDLFKVVPGVTSVSQANQTSQTTGLDTFSINGTRQNSHNLTIDGASNVDPGDNGGVHVTVNPDAVQEVKLLTSNYQAEYGKAGGGTIQYVTKSGTNDFHGSARYFRRHDSLNANPFFNNARAVARPLYRYNYYGYDIGGPVFLPRFGEGGPGFFNGRDKLFFFFSQEYYQQLVPNAARNIRVPTVQERNGDFSNTRTAAGALVVIRDPVTGLPFPGNIIPANRFYAQGQNILNIFPLPNTNVGGANYTSQVSSDFPRREDILRIDYNLSQETRISARFINNSDKQGTPYGAFGGATASNNFALAPGTSLTRPGYNMAFTLFHAFTPTLTNEFIFGPSRNRVTVDTFGDPRATRTGTGALFPQLFAGVNSGDYLPTLNFGAITGLAALPTTRYDNLPFIANGSTYDIINNLTKVFDRHTIKTGIFIQRHYKVQNAPALSNATINFSNGGNNPLDTGNGYANALLGIYQTYQQASATPVGNLRYNNIEGYVQDTWKITPRLTLDYGLRLTYYQPLYERDSQFSSFNTDFYRAANAVRLYRPVLVGAARRAVDPAQTGAPTVANTQPVGFIGRIVPNSGDLTNGIAQARNGYFEGGFEGAGLQFEPRFGFAYQATNDGKTVIRGGAGISHDRTQDNPIRELLSNPPNIFTPTLFFGNLADIGAAGSTATLGTPNIFGFSPDGDLPTVYSMSLGVQRDIGAGTVIDVAYVGTLSRHLLQQRNLNATEYGAAFRRENQDPTLFPGGVVPAVEANLPQVYRDAGLSFSGQNALPENLLRPFQGYGTINYREFVGTANYNSLQVAVNRRFSNNFTFGLAYTFSKVFTTSSTDTQESTSRFGTRERDYRLASYDRTHNLVVNYVIDVPKPSSYLGGAGDNKIVNAILGGFQVSGITQYISGNPLELGFGINGVSAAQRITGSFSEGPRLLLLRDPRTDADRNGSQIDPTAFALPSIGSTGVGNRTYLRNPGFFNTDLSLFKNFGYAGGREKGRYVQLRVELFNVFNITQFTGINTAVTLAAPATATNLPGGADRTAAANVFANYGTAVITNNLRPAGSTQPLGTFFGEYNGTRDPRIIQLGVKLYF